MEQPPTPDADVPGFIVDRFADHDPETLCAIATYARTGVRPATLPYYVVEAFVIQDAITRRAVANYALELARHLETADTVVEAPAERRLAGELNAINSLFLS